jgi:hypothetical protein
MNYPQNLKKVRMAVQIERIYSPNLTLREADGGKFDEEFLYFHVKMEEFLIPLFQIEEFLTPLFQIEEFLCFQLKMEEC